jgi:hypothetical protein
VQKNRKASMEMLAAHEMGNQWLDMLDFYSFPKKG